MVLMLIVLGVNAAAQILREASARWTG